MSYDQRLVVQLAALGFIPRGEEGLTELPDILVERALKRVANSFALGADEMEDFLNQISSIPGAELAAFGNESPESVIAAAAAAAITDTITKRLDDYYTANFKKVYNNVMGWFGTTTNGCVAFLSSALRLSGYPVPPINGPSAWGPRNPDGTGAPHLISEWTGAFQWWIAKQGWQKIVGTNQLQRGDVVFANDSSGDPVPTHVFEFHSWQDQANLVAIVLDNQNGDRGLHPRPLNRPGVKDPYKYHFRK